MMLTPIFLYSSMTWRWVPCITDTRVVTDPTPMMMPSMVRKERILFCSMDLRAMEKAWKNFMLVPPPAIGAPAYPEG